MSESLFNKAEGSQDGRAKKLVAQLFYKENSAQGYFTKPEFVKYAEQLTASEAKDFVGLLDQMNAAAKVNFKLIPREDKSGRRYVWVDFQFAKGNLGYKVIIASDIIRFIEEYAIGLIKVNFTAEDLSQEALNG